MNKLNEDVGLPRIGPADEWDAKARKMTNLADPEDDQDAVTKAHLETYLGSEYAAAAEASATAAAGSATAAADSATAAEASKEAIDDMNFGAMAEEDDAPSDGNEYVRKDGEWAVATVGNQFVNNYAAQCGGTGIVSSANVKSCSFVANRAMLNTTAQSSVDNTGSTHELSANAW